jgi:23S rRNA pseudouridine1911/1915/1917 synthase
MSTPPRELTVPPASEGARLDAYVGEALGLSRARVKRLFDEGAVRVGGRGAKKGQTVRAGERVSVLLEDASPAPLPEPEAPLAVLHADAEVLVVDKPAGRPSHPLKPGETGTVANALVARYPECLAASEDPREAGLCHRLDVETSGALLVARTRPAWDALRAAFSARAVDKRYWALVTGPLVDEGEVEVPLRHHPRHPDRVEPALDEGPPGREALSRFRALARASEYTLVEVTILTGVLHQVRAHLAAIGAPLVGDALYGGREEPGLGRFFLHARALGFTHPVSGARVQVESPLPEELLRVLEARGLRP